MTNGKKKISIVYNFKLKDGLIFTKGEEEKRGRKKKRLPRCDICHSSEVGDVLLYDRRRSLSS